MSAAEYRRPAPADSEAILNALPHPIIVIAPDGKIVDANMAAESFFDISAQFLRRQSLKELVPFGSPLLALIDQVRAANSPVNEYKVDLGTPRIGGDRQVDLHVAPLTERPGHIVVMLQERTIADKMDRQLTHRSAARSVIALAAMLAHEIKNPLSGIRGAAQLLAGGELTSLIVSEVDRIAALIDRMQDFSDTRPLPIQAENIYPLIGHARRLALAGFARGIALEERFDPSLPHAAINRDALLQILINLLKNAAEATRTVRQPRIAITTAYRHGMSVAPSGGGRRVPLPIEICVTDNGPGAPDDIAEYLFDPFISGRPEGQGLGLALVDKLMRDMGGIVQYAREGSPEMTTLRLLLPRATA